jgi:hypothetical protein
MPSKKELYEQAKQLKKNGGPCGALSTMNKANLLRYINGEDLLKKQMKPLKGLDTTKFIKKPTIAKKIKSKKTIVQQDVKEMTKKKKTKKIKIKIKKKDKLKSEMQLLKSEKVKPFLKKQNIIKTPQSIPKLNIEMLKKMAQKKVAPTPEEEEKEKFIPPFRPSGVEGLEVANVPGSRAVFYRFRGKIYVPIRGQYFERIISALLNHENGIANPKMFGLKKADLNQSRKSIKRILENLKRDEY